MAQFMRQDSYDLLGLALLDEGIIDNNVLLPGHSKEIGVAVGAPLTAINHVQLVERELELSSESLDSSLQFSGFQGSELVEEGHNDDWPDGDHDNLQTRAKHP